MVILVIVLVCTVLALGLYNYTLSKRIQLFNNQSEKITNLNILQDFMRITGNDYSVDKKIETINQIIIEKYQIKYSSIVVFDGTDYVIKASNVTKDHWDALSRLHEVDIFRDSITTASPKYITINNTKEPEQNNKEIIINYLQNNKMNNNIIQENISPNPKNNVGSSC